MKSIKAFVLDYPKKLKDEIKYGSLVLHDYRNIKSEWKSILHGTVLEEPLGEETPVKKGDKIYFDYLVPDNKYNTDLKEGQLRVPVRNVQCYIRNGEIIPYQGRVLTEPAFPADTEDIEVDGKTIKAQLTESGLVKSIDIKYSKKLTRICHVCENDLGLNKGDMVVMTQASDQRYEIEGKWYFVIPVNEIIARYELCESHKPHDGSTPLVLRP